MKKFLSIVLPIFIIFCTTCTFAKTYNVATASYSILINDEEVEFTKPILNVNGNTYLSLTEIAKILDIEVNWNEELHQVEINKNSNEENTYVTDEFEEDTEESYWWEWDSISEDNYWWEWDSDSDIEWDESEDEIDYPETNYTDEEAISSEDTSSSSGDFVGSKSGSKYHISTCYWVEKIKAENKIYFSSKNQAENKDYKPCSSCLK